MKSITKTAESKELAIKLALEELNLSEDDVVIEVLEVSKKGFMGMFSKPYTIKVTEKENNFNDCDSTMSLQNNKNISTKNTVSLDKDEKEIVEKVKSYLTNITNLMDISICDFSVSKNERGIVLNIDDNNTGAIIGKRGELLDSFDYLINIVVNNDMNRDYKRIILDSNSYRDRREKSLKSFAKKMGLSAIKTAKIKTLEPMKPYDRRIVHSVIQELEGVESYSIGKEPYRKVVIKPSNYNSEKAYAPKKYNRHKRSSEENTKFVKASVDSTVKLKIFDDSHKLYSKIEIDKKD